MAQPPKRRNRKRPKMKNYDTEQYLRDFDSMPPEKQGRHLVFIINWLVAIIRGRPVI